MAASVGELAPLLRQEETDLESTDDSAWSEMEYLQPRGVISARAKHMAVFTAAALGAMLVVAVLFFQSTRSPLRARVQALASFADGTCIWPEGFCQEATSYFLLRDCDGDGIPDPTCFDTDGKCECIGSASKCSHIAAPCKRGTLLCERPYGWCAGPGKDQGPVHKDGGVVRPDIFIYSTLDCDGDGQPDPFCQKADEKTGEFTCGCLQSSMGCRNNFPSRCSDMDVAPMQMLHKTRTQIALKSTASGTLMFLKVTIGGKVAAGDEVFAVVDKNTIRHIKSPIDGTVKDVLDVKTGDHVTRGEPLIILDTIAPSVKNNSKPSKHFKELPFLTGFEGKPILAKGFKGLDIFDGWGTPSLRPGIYVQKGKTFALLQAKSGAVKIEMPEDGVITGLQPLKVGDKVNDGGQLGFYKPATDGVKLHVKPGFEVLRTPVSGTFMRWKVHVGDLIPNGGAVADFDSSDARYSTLQWGGPTGMVFERQNLSPITGLKKGTDLIIVGAGVFVTYRVKPGDVIARGSPICILKVGADLTPVPATKDGSVLELPNVKLGDRIGFNTPLALFQEFKSDDEDEVKYNITAESAGLVTVGKPVDVSSKIGHSHYAKVKEVKEVQRRRAQFPWWILLMLLACGCLVVILRFCMKPSSLESADLPTAEPTSARTLVVQPPLVAVPPLVPVEPQEMVPEEQEEEVFEEEDHVEEPPDPPPEPPPEPPKEPPRPPPAPAPAPPPSAPEPTPAPVQAPAPILTPSPVQTPRQGVELYFDNKFYKFDHKPIGVNFHTDPPVRIHNFPFNSYGKTLGLQANQRLTKIKDFEVKSNFVFSGTVEQKLLVEMQRLPYWPLRVEFRTPSGESAGFDFVERPLGIYFTKHIPIKIEKFKKFSLAERMGVQAGWEITRIANEDTSAEGMARIGIKKNAAAYNKVDTHLMEGLAHLPFWKVPIEFKIPPDGTIQRLEFAEKPIGMKFTKHIPPKVNRVDARSIASELGVQIGWEIMRIGDVDVRAEFDFKHVQKAFDDYVDHLPKKKR